MSVVAQAGEALFEDIPPWMRDAPRFLLWKFEPNPDPAKKPRKTPFYVNGRKRNGRLDSPEDVAQLATFAAAVRVLEGGGYAGLGFALGQDDEGCWQGIDLDHLPEHPELTEIAATLPGYVERSPGGQGLHAIGYGRRFAALTSNASGIEAYSSGRFFTVTGAAVKLDSRPEDLADLVGTVLEPLHGGGRRKPAQSPATPVEPVSDADWAVLDRDLREALHRIPADGRGLWVKIGHALKTLGERAWPLFDDWSQTAPKKYGGQQSARADWDSFRPESISYRAVFAEAKTWGWDSRADPQWLLEIEDKIVEVNRTAPSAAEFFACLGVRKAEPPPAPEAKPEPAPKGVQPLPLFRHGDAKVVTPRWAIRNRLPESGVGLLPGQWGTFKTFLTLDLSAHLMLGWDWAGQPVYRRGGVLVLAPEGASGLPLRMTALVENIIEPRKDEVPEGIDPKRLPFMWSELCPPLLDKVDPLPVLLATAEAAKACFETEYQLPLSLILIDTMAVAARFQNENDNGEVSRAMAVLHDLSRQAGAVVLGVDHLGKNVTAGARGASAKEANADFVLEVQGTRDSETGSVSDSRLVLRKMRDGPQGEEIAFDPITVDMGEDDHGYPVTSVVIRWDVVREPKAKKEKPRSETERLLDTALNEALRDKGATMERPGGREVRAARRGDVRDAFRAIYKPRVEDPDNRARDECFRRTLDASQVRIARATIDGTEFLWRAGEDDVPI